MKHKQPRKIIQIGLIAFCSLLLPVLMKAQTPSPRLTYTADGSKDVQSFTVRTTAPEVLVKVKFPDGIEAEATSSPSDRMTKFAHRIPKETPKPWRVEIFTEGIESFATQETGITEIDFSHCAEIKRITLPYQLLKKVNTSTLTELQELYLHGNSQLKEIDLTNNNQLKRLNISNTDGLQVKGLEECGEMTHLHAYNTSLTNPNLAKLTKLQVLDLTNTKTNLLDLSQNTALTELELMDNNLTRLDLSKQKNLKRLKLGSNKLTELELGANPLLEELDVNNNELVRLILPREHLTNLDCGKNHLALSQLPAKGKLSSYIYWPQKDFPVPARLTIGKVLDLSSENKAKGVVSDERNTLFFVYDKAGNSLEENTDYKIENGRFTFLKEFSEPIRIKVKNSAFPKLDKKDALYSNFFTVGPEEAVSSIVFTTNKAKGEYIGLGIKTVEGEVEVEGATFDSESGVRYYVVNQEKITLKGKITLLDAANNGITSIDISNAAELKTLACDNNSLTKVEFGSSNNGLQKLLLGQNPLLKELNLSTSPALEELSCYKTGISTLDLSSCPNLRELVCRNTDMKGVLNLSHNPLIEQISCFSCDLSEIRLEKNNLRHIECERNNITGAAMTALMKALPLFQPYSSDEWDDYQGYNLQGIYIVELSDKEKNRCLDTDVRIAQSKNWPVYSMTVEAYGEEKPKPYQGIDTGLDAAEGYQLTLYPNPATDYALLSGIGSMVNHVKILDLCGRTVNTLPTEGSTLRLDLRHLPSGNYIIVAGNDYRRLQIRR